jgi:hypothetical protein
VAPFLARWTKPVEAGRVAEWATRIVLSYAIAPSATMDLTDPVRATHLVETYMLPGISALHATEMSAAIDITPFELERDTPDHRSGPHDNNRNDRNVRTEHTTDTDQGDTT